MALTTLFEIVTRAVDEMGLHRPATVYGSAVAETRQMLALLNATGRDLMSIHPWSALIETATITLVANQSSYPLPADFDRLLDSAAWDSTSQSALAGGITQQKHAYWLSSGVTASTVNMEYRLTVQLNDNSLHIHPVPTTTASLKFFYVRNTWVTAGITDYPEYTSDTDTTVFNPQLMVKELKWRFKASKGLDAVDLIVECNQMRDRLIAADIASPPLDMGGLMPGDPIDYLVPDSNWDL